MKNEIINMPKVELHLHLDGSLNKELISKKYNIDINELNKKMSVDETCQDLNDYLTKFDYPISIMQTKEELKEFTLDLCERLKEQNIIYAEIRFAPAFHTNKGLTQKQVIESVIDGLNESNTNYNLILCCMRNIDENTNKETIELAKYFSHNRVVAIDLAGAESLYPTKKFKEIFDYATSLNIPFTIHAGEAAADESILSAISFGAKRIGHGIKCIDNKELINEIIDKKITLEICPTSNINTKAVTDMTNHPINKLYKLGVKTTINTDNMTVSNIDLNKEYIKLQETFNYTIDDFKKMNIYAIDSSFINNEEKQKLKDIIRNYQ